MCPAARFIDTLNAQGNVTPELELLGETLKRLWLQNKTLAFQASRDSLTDPLNRRGIHVQLMLMDIDLFKKITAQHGHDLGARILRHVAQVLKTNLRRSDLVGRYGGEELIVFLHSVKETAILALAEKRREQIASPPPGAPSITISIGLTSGILTSGNISQEIKTLLYRSDEALYKAKKQGRNHCVLV